MSDIPTREQAWLDILYFDDDPAVSSWDSVQAKYDAVQTLHAYAAGELKTEEQWKADSENENEA